jgi:hypothetical protein
MEIQKTITYDKAWLKSNILSFNKTLNSKYANVISRDDLTAIYKKIKNDLQNFEPEDYISLKEICINQEKLDHYIYNEATGEVHKSDQNDSFSEEVEEEEKEEEKNGEAKKVLEEKNGEAKKVLEEIRANDDANESEKDFQEKVKVMSLEEEHEKHRKVILNRLIYYKDKKKSGVPDFHENESYEVLLAKFTKFTNLRQMSRDLEIFKFIIVIISHSLEWGVSYATDKMGVTNGLKGWAQQIQLTIDEYEDLIDDYIQDQDVKISPRNRLLATLFYSAIKFASMRMMTSIHKEKGNRLSRIMKAPRNLD